MNRNAAIGLVLAGVLLAAISVGVSTYMANGGLESQATQIQEKVDALAADLSGQLVQVSATAEQALPRENGEAVALRAVSTLWSRGTLLVSSQEDSAAVFAVDPEEGAVRIAGKAEMGDVEAGTVLSTGLTADVLQTTSGNWAVDEGGTMNASGDLVVNGDGEIGQGLLVKGSSFGVGDNLTYAHRFDAKAADYSDTSEDVESVLREQDGSSALTVDGVVIAKRFISTAKDGYEFAQNVIFDRDVRQSKNTWSVTDTGDATFNTVKANALNHPKGDWSVTSEGVAKLLSIKSTKAQGSDGYWEVADDGSATFGLVNAAGLNGSGDAWYVTETGGATFDSVNAAQLNSSGDDWWVAADGTGHFKALNASGDDWWVTSAGSASFASASIDGTMTVDGSEIGAGGFVGDDKDVLARDIIANRILAVGDEFVVDHNGNVQASGDLVVNGDFQGAQGSFTSLDVTSLSTGGILAGAGSTIQGDQGSFASLDVTSLSIDGSAFNPGVGNDPGTDVTCRDLVASRVIELGDVFSVDNAGNVALAGDLDVAGDAAVDGNLTVTGVINADDVDSGGNVSAAGDGSFGGAIDVTGSASIGGDLTIGGTLSAANLRSGIQSCAVGSTSVAVGGMPAGAAVVVTPRGAVTGPYYVTVAAGQFDIVSSDAVDYSWIATW